jgi:hypothetical protein
MHAMYAIGPSPYQPHPNYIDNMKFAFASILALALAAVGVLSIEVRAPQPDLAPLDAPAVSWAAPKPSGSPL